MPIATLALALLPAAAQAGLGDRVLRLGARGADVRALQGYLDAAGYTLTQTGRYDRPTRGRVQSFQNDFGLRATGVVTRRVARMIRTTATARPGYGGTMFDPNPPRASGPAPTNLKVVPGNVAKVLSDGTAAAPANAPDEVKRVIASANEIAKLPYKWGGGHGSWRDTGYDCTGSVTYAFRTTFRRGAAPTFGYSNWGLAGPGKWVTVYANSGHVYAVIAGLRYDSSGLRVAGSRWTSQARSSASFVARHPAGY
ncbi:MAG TPA: peptidoglycan-binding domain-containing protein [Solirubrobacteraceae bacterium]|nr:peptidoglycan-binding domain-containing protein [Solirubrobacteraceae bacterium]